MASLRDSQRIFKAAARQSSLVRSSATCARRWASTGSADATLADLETETSTRLPAPDEAMIQSWNPADRAKARTRQLPGSRYQYHPPKYDRGPLHPVQSPPSSDPQARDFIPGPFNLPRLKTTYREIVAPDLMTLAYLHTPPGTAKDPERVRLRPWDGSSPYHKNRPLRGPRGASTLSLIEDNIGWRNIPEIKAVSIHSFVGSEAARAAEWLVVARNVVQAISGATPQVTKIKRGVSQWGTRNGNNGGAKATIQGDAAYEFVDKLINFVFPRIKDWPGIKASTGDSSGNLTFGLDPEEVQFFPEVEVNFDMYPRRMLPGCHVTIQTTAKSDRHARLLLQALGFPFNGEFKD